VARPLEQVSSWQEDVLESACRNHAEATGIGFGKLAQPLRVALTGSTVSPGIFEIMRVLGRAEVLARIEDAAAGRNSAAAPVG
jgi:glutamyl-tRNA synthetase